MRVAQNVDRSGCSRTTSGDTAFHAGETRRNTSTGRTPTRQRQSRLRQPAAQRYREPRAQQAVEQQVERQAGNGAGQPKPAADRRVAVEHAGHQVFRRPEAAALPDGAHSHPRQHPPNAQHARLKPGQKRGDEVSRRRSVAAVHKFQPILTSRPKAKQIHASSSHHRNRRRQPQRNWAGAFLGKPRETA